jgi:hypothetical protein
MRVRWWRQAGSCVLGGCQARWLLAECCRHCETQVERVQAAAVFERSPSKVNRVLRKRRVAPISGMDLVLAAEAAAIIGGILPCEMSVPARAGLVRSVRSTKRGHRLYVKADVKAVARRQTVLTARTLS